MEFDPDRLAKLAGIKGGDLSTESTTKRSYRNSNFQAERLNESSTVNEGVWNKVKSAANQVLRDPTKAAKSLEIPYILMARIGMRGFGDTNPGLNDVADFIGSLGVGVGVSRRHAHPNEMGDMFLKQLKDFKVSLEEYLSSWLYSDVKLQDTTMATNNRIFQDEKLDPDRIPGVIRGVVETMINLPGILEKMRKENPDQFKYMEDRIRNFHILSPKGTVNIISPEQAQQAIALGDEISHLLKMGKEGRKNLGESALSRRSPESKEVRQLRQLIRTEASQVIREMRAERRALAEGDLTRLQTRRSLTEAVAMGFYGPGFAGSRASTLGGPMTASGRLSRLFENQENILPKVEAQFNVERTLIDAGLSPEAIESVESKLQSMTPEDMRRAEEIARKLEAQAKAAIGGNTGNLQENWFKKLLHHVNPSNWSSKSKGQAVSAGAMATGMAIPIGMMMNGIYDAQTPEEYAALIAAVGIFLGGNIGRIVSDSLLSSYNNKPYEENE